MNAFRAVTEELVEPPPTSNSLHVGDLDGSISEVSIRNRVKGWKASVIVKVHDENGKRCTRSSGHRNLDRRLLR